jgi:hypothetical protein
MSRILNARWALTHESRLPIFHWWGRHHKQLISRRLWKLYCPAAQQQQFYSSTVHFAHIIRDCLGVKFPGLWIERGGPIEWPLVLLWERPSVQPQSEYAGRTQSTDKCSNLKCYKGHVTARLARSGLEMGCMQSYRWRPLCNNFSTCV